MYLKSTFLILLVSFQLVLCAPPLFGHSDCNAPIFFDNIMRLCYDYDGFRANVLKREIAEKVAANLPIPKGYGKEAFYQYLQQAIENQSIREYPYPWQTPQRNNRPLPPSLPFPYPWQIPSRNAYSLQQPPPTPPYTSDFQPSSGDVGDSLQMKNDFLDPTNYVEPQDFETFNYWYLNPVYNDVDFKGRNKRWKRNVFDDFIQYFKNLPGKLSTELWDFFHLKCCGKGCSYPNEFAKLDARINFCRMN